MARGINVIALVKESERYIFLYDDESPAALLQTFGRYASDPELSFSWYDAAMLSQKVRRSQREQADAVPAPHTPTGQRFPKSAASADE